MANAASPRFAAWSSRRGLVFEGPDQDGAGSVGFAAALAVAGCALALGGGWIGGLLGVVAGFIAARLGRFRLTLAPDGPVLERRVLGLTFDRLHLPTGITGTREGLLDWGLDGDDGTEALCAIALDGIPEPLLIGTRADADTLPSAVEAALESTYGRERDRSHARLAKNRPWTHRLQARLAGRALGRLRPWTSPSLARASGAGTEQPGRLVTSTLLAGLLDWEFPNIGVAGATAALVLAPLASWRGHHAAAFALIFAVAVLSLLRFTLLLREDRVLAEIDGAGIAALTVERRWMGLCFRRRTLARPAFVFTNSWRSPHPVLLSAWSGPTGALDASRIPLDAEAAAAWRLRLDA